MVTDGKKKIEEEWPCFLEEIGFENIIKRDMEEEMSLFYESYQDIIEEYFEDIYYIAKIKFEVNDIKAPIAIDPRKVLRFAGIGVGVGAAIVGIICIWNPVGWLIGISAALGVIATSLEAIASVFSKPEIRRQKAIEKIRSDIKKSVDKSKPEQIDKLLKTIDFEMIKKIEEVKRIYTMAIEVNKEALYSTETLKEAYRYEIEKLNKVYAWRICEFLAGNKGEFQYEKIMQEIISVERNGREMLIKRKYKKKYDTSKLSEIIADNIMFE